MSEGCGVAKWLWRFPRESHSLWHKVIRSKYGLQVNGWDASPPRRASSRSPWKDISSGYHQFLRYCKFEVGNGERVRFWEDEWSAGDPLKEQFPRLFLLSRKHNHIISSFVEVLPNSLSWNFDFRRNLNEMEIEEAARLLQKVEEVQLSLSKMDNRRWNLEASGLFTCKSYRSLLSNDGIVQVYPPYSQVWKSKAPPKVKILVWLVANGNLNTCDRIQRRNPLMCLSPHWCSLCKAKEESVNHIFLHCSYSIQLWWKLLQEVNVSWVIPKGCFELLSINFKALGKGKKSKVLWGCLVSAIFWNIWLERNKRIFEDYTGVGAEVLWGRVKYWAAFWASVTNEFKNCSLSQILWDLLAAVK